MKRIINWSAIFIAVGVSFIAGIFVGNPIYQSQKTKLDAWVGYYVCTEHLLDLLERKYQWVDAFDHDGYYETKCEVTYLDSVNISRAYRQYQICLTNNNKYNENN